MTQHAPYMSHDDNKLSLSHRERKVWAKSAYGSNTLNALMGNDNVTDLLTIYAQYDTGTKQ